MATTRREGAPAKERTTTKSSLAPATMHNPRVRTTKPSSPAPSSSEKDAAASSKPTPNYLKPTLSSNPDAFKQAKEAAPAGTTRSSQKTVLSKKGADAKALPQRSSSFTAPRQAKTTLSSRTSFSDRKSKGKVAYPSLKVETSRKAKPSSSSTKGTVSGTSSANTSATTSPRAATEGTLSNEDKEAALDILNLDIEEHVLLEIPQVEDKTLPDEPIHPEHPEEVTSPVGTHDHVANPAMVQDVEMYEEEQHDDPADDGEKGKKDEKSQDEVSSVEGEEKEEEAEKAEEAEEKAVVEGPGAEGEGEAAKVDANGQPAEEAAGVDGGGGERVMLRVSGVEDEAAAKEKKKEVQQKHGKKEAAPAYNDVIEETASKLAGQRKNKVLALVGAFETVITLDSGAPSQ